MKTQGRLLQKSKSKRPSGPPRRANELEGKTWLKYSISIWDDIKKNVEELKLKHPAMFPSELPMRLIQMFTNQEQKSVLDPFLGSGSTLIAAKMLDKYGIGFEISKEYVDLAHRRLNSQEYIFSKNLEQRIIQDDARNMLEYLEQNSIDLCITSPPYWDILCQKRSADNKQIKNYAEKIDNLGEIPDYNDFLEELKHIFRDVFFLLNPGSYCIVIVMDIRKKNRYYCFHADISRFMEQIGFIFDDIIIWNRKQEYSNLRPLGYPFVFRVNKIHEYILIFQKPKASKK